MSKFNRVLGLKHIYMYLDLLLLKIIVLSFVNSVKILSNLNKGDGAIMQVSSAYIKLYKIPLKLHPIMESLRAELKSSI